MNRNHRAILSWLAEADDTEVAAVLELIPFLSPAPGVMWLENEGKRFCYETLGPSMKSWHYGPTGEQVPDTYPLDAPPRPDAM